MPDSILNSVKKVVGLPPEAKDFDDDLILYTNVAFAKLNQLGVGSARGFRIEDDKAVWDEFYTDYRFDDIRGFVVLYVRLLFDPPSIGVVNQALKSQIEEITWRISERREEDEWENRHL